MEPVLNDAVSDVVVPPLGGKEQMRKGLLSKAIILAYPTTNINMNYNNRIKKGYTISHTLASNNWLILIKHNPHTT